MMLRGRVILGEYLVMRCAKGVLWGLNGVSTENRCLELQVAVCEC